MKRTSALAKVQAVPQLLKIEEARALIAKCIDIDEARSIRNKAIAIGIYQRETKAAKEVRDDAFEIALRAERRLGELLAVTEKHTGGRPPKKDKKTGTGEVPVSKSAKLTDLGLSKRDSQRAQKLAALPEEEFDKRIKIIREKADTTGKLTANAVLSKSAASDHDGDSWMTPIEIIQKVRAVLGGVIELDPMTSVEAQQTVRALKYYTEETDGLSESNVWEGKTFMNPPFSAALIQAAIDKLAKAVESGKIPQAVLLVNNATDTAWCQRHLERYPACFTRGRLGFRLPGGEVVPNNRQGQILFFINCDMQIVRKEFTEIGVIVAPMRKVN